jgi:hypothetical protein
MRKLIGLVLIAVILFGMYNAYNNFKGEGTTLTENVSTYVRQEYCEHDWIVIATINRGNAADKLLGNTKKVEIIACTKCDAFDER